MKTCSHCGKELLDEAVICPQCGCPVQAGAFKKEDVYGNLAEKVKINAIIWLCVAGVQALGGLAFGQYWMLIVAALNVYWGVKDLQYSKLLPEHPEGVVQKFEPLVAPIITLAYNLIFGALIGVAGSVYYLVAIRNYVMTNKEHFS